MIHLLAGVAAPVSLYPAEPVDSGSGVARLVAPSGEVVDSSSWTSDDTDEELTVVGTTPDVLEIADTTELVAGRTYWLSSQRGVGAPVTVSELTSATELQLEEPPPFTPIVGDRLLGLRLSATLTAGARGKHHRVEWTYTRDSVAGQEQESAHVVRMLFRPPIDAAGAVRVARSSHSAWAGRQTAGHWTSLARRANDLVYRELVKTADTYPHMLGDARALEGAGETAVRLLLARRGLVEAGWTAQELAVELSRQLSHEVREIVAGMHVDRDDEGDLDPGDVRALSTVMMVRA